MRRGFSLMEALMAMGLFSIILGLAVPSYLANNRIQRVVAVRDMVRQKYIQARDNANAGKKDCSVCGCANNGTDAKFQGWAVNYTTVGITRYANLFGVCGNNSYPTIGYVSFYTTPSKITSGITVVASNAPNGVMFRPNGQGIYPVLATGTNITVTVSNGILSEDQTFIITSAGQIQ